MFSDEFVIGWVLYLCATLMFMLIVVWMMRRLPSLFFYPLVLGLLVFLVVPWTVSSTHEQLAPAWVIMIFDGLVRDAEPLTRAGTPLLAAVVVALLLGVLLGWWRRGRA